MSHKVNVAVMACLMGLAVAIVSSAPNGRIKGRVIDKETKDPIVGASVMLVNTKLGAITDSDGVFVIARIPPDTYTVRITSIDYSTLEVKDVVVKSDLTTEISQKLEKKVTDIGKTIRVTAQGSDVIQKYETSNQVSITSQSIQTKPKQNVDQLIRQVGGVRSNERDRSSIRGGRAGEIYNEAPKTPPHIQCSPGWPPSHGGTAIVNGQPFDAMFFKDYGTIPFVDTEDDHFSTFAIDVDDASYVMTRSHLEQRALPPHEAVRAEEFINHFAYDYPSPESDPFSINMEGAPSRFGTPNVWLLRVGIQGRRVTLAERAPANLVFVVDASGSMSIDNRLELVKQALMLVVNQLRPNDKVAIVAYGSYAQFVLGPTYGRNRDVIGEAIEQLRPGGSTNAEDGLSWGYLQAREMFDEHRLNRVILCSDGVANVGETNPDGILRQIEDGVKVGITLTTVGFGMDNYNDILLEWLGDKGNGHYAYVDDMQEARRVFVDNLAGTLEVIARDVKIQVDFDPRVVRSYRLIGYENRDVADTNFRNDTIDGGEIGSGHQVTALYELKLHGALDRRDLGKINIRYKDADMRTVREIGKAIKTCNFSSSFDEASSDFRLAAAAGQFAEILRESYWAKGESLDDVLAVAQQVSCRTQASDVSELVHLIQLADELERPVAKR